MIATGISSSELKRANFSISALRRGKFRTRRLLPFFFLPWIRCLGGRWRFWPFPLSPVRSCGCGAIPFHFFPLFVRRMTSAFSFFPMKGEVGPFFPSCVGRGEKPGPSWRFEANFLFGQRSRRNLSLFFPFSGVCQDTAACFPLRAEISKWPIFFFSLSLAAAPSRMRLFFFLFLSLRIEHRPEFAFFSPLPRRRSPSEHRAVDPFVPLFFFSSVKTTARSGS